LSTVSKIIHETSHRFIFIALFSFIGFAAIDQITPINQKKIAFSKITIHKYTISYKLETHTKLNYKHCKQCINLSIREREKEIERFYLTKQI